MLVPFDAVVRNGELWITVQQANATKENIESAFQKQLNLYQHALATLASDVAGWNDGLNASVAELVSARRDQLLRARDVVASLEFPVRRREDAVIPVAVKRRVHVTAARPMDRETFQPEHELPLADYEEIIAAMRSMGIVMERAPGAFAGLTEEGVRDFFLAVLNVGFRGDAMAEVFNGEGKTDILIRVGERNVFVAEFKVWGGEEEFRKAIDQLLRNMGWRDTKASIVLLVRNRNVTDVVDTADRLLRDHKCFKRTTPHPGGELERRYVFHWPGDEKRELIITLQAFAVPDAPGKRQRRKGVAE
ncbi:MAG TPA: hypothetical protein VEX62_11045 [Candidatus Limnocylindrales bacterium]|nr:hypothetical protein [Candidatus Limnocylindrales bacterium]